MLKHILYSAITAGALLALNLVAFRLLAMDWHWLYTLSHLYFFALSSVYSILFVKFPRPQTFIQVFMAFSGVKLFFSAFLLLVVALKWPGQLVVVAVLFLALYFIHTASEIVRLLGQLKKV